MLKRYLHIIIVSLIFSCQGNDETNAPEETTSCQIDAEILGQDLTKHACSGGYIIRLSNQETFTVYDLLDDQITSEAFQLTIFDEPIAVKIDVTDLKDSSCSHYAKVLTCISRVD